MDLTHLMSQEFVEFSEKIKELHEQKTQLIEEFKELYAEHKLKVKDLDDQALALQDTFDKWTNRDKSPKE